MYIYYLIEHVGILKYFFFVIVVEKILSGKLREKYRNSSFYNLHKINFIKECF